MNKNAVHHKLLSVVSTIIRSLCFLLICSQYSSSRAAFIKPSGLIVNACASASQCRDLPINISSAIRSTDVTTDTPYVFYKALKIRSAGQNYIAVIHLDLNGKQLDWRLFSNNGSHLGTIVTSHEGTNWISDTCIAPLGDGKTIYMFGSKIRRGGELGVKIYGENIPSWFNSNANILFTFDGVMSYSNPVNLDNKVALDIGVLKLKHGKIIRTLDQKIVSEAARVLQVDCNQVISSQYSKEK